MATSQLASSVTPVVIDPGIDLGQGKGKGASSSVGKDALTSSLPIAQEAPRGAPDGADPTQRGVEHVLSSCYVASILNLIAATPGYRAAFDPAVTVLPAQSPGRRLQDLISPLVATLTGNGVVAADRVRAVIRLLGELGMLQQHEGELEGAQQDANQVLLLMLDRVFPVGGDVLTTRETRTYTDQHQPAVRDDQRQFVLQLNARGHRTLEAALRAYFVTDAAGPVGDNPHTTTRRATGFPSMLSIAMARVDAGDTIDMPIEFTPPADIAVDGVARPRYRLQAFIVRDTFSEDIGGHYVAVLRTGDRWIESDDIGRPKQGAPDVHSPRTRAIDVGTHMSHGQASPAHMLATLYTYVRVAQPDDVGGDVGAVPLRGGQVQAPPEEAAPKQAVEPVSKQAVEPEPKPAVKDDERTSFESSWLADPEARDLRVKQAMARALSALSAMGWGSVNTGGGFLGAVPGGPEVRFKGTWYTRAQLKDAVVRDPKCFGAAHMPDLVALIDHLTPGREFADWSVLNRELCFIRDNAIDGKRFDTVAHKRESEARARRAQQQREREDAERQAAVAQAAKREIAGTSMESMLAASEQIEQEIGKRAAQHEKSQTAATEMATRVMTFITAYQRLSGVDLAPELGTTNKETAGAVGKDAETVRAALVGRDATLHERMTHVLAFREVLGGLLLKPETKVHARTAAIEAGFDATALDELARGAGSKHHDAIFALKSEIVQRRGGPVATNTQSAASLGIPFSDRERALWGGDTPTFGVGEKQVDVNAKHDWVKEKRAQGLPVKSGPSTHTLEIFEVARLLGLEARLPADDLRMAATGYLLPIGAHSLVEIEHVAAMFGCELARGPEAYAQRLLALGGIRAPKLGTGQALFAGLRGYAGKPDLDADAQMIAAHHYLLAHGYVFAGFHGSSKTVCNKIFEGGINQKDGGKSRKADDPWSGFYLAPSLETATGYSGENAGDKSTAKPAEKPPEQTETALLRVYAPASIVEHLTQARLSLDRGDAVLDELRGRLGHALPAAQDYYILGREADLEPDLEAVMSWHAAEQCIAIPSLHERVQGGRGVAKHSAVEAGLSNNTGMPSHLTFEGEAAPSSSGGNQLDGASSSSAPEQWEPSEQHRKHTAWGGGAAYLARSPSGGPSPVQVRQLNALGIPVKPGATWAAVNAESLKVQANANSLQEMLEQLGDVPVGSPAWRDFAMRFASAKDATEIAPKLFLSGQATASNMAWQQGHVKLVLNCCQYSFPHAEGVAYVDCEVTGFEDGLFEWTSKQIAAAMGGGVLVHCIEGKNRSATVVAAYLMKTQGLKAVAAIRVVCAARPWAEPDLPSLLAWEKFLAGKKSTAKAVDGAVDKGAE